MEPEKRPLGLYLHIPFCRSKCAYCDFYSLPAGGAEAMDRYAAALDRALEEARGLASRYRVDSVYFGGGTPSYFGSRRLAGLLEAILERYPVDSGAEITLEANPDSLEDPADILALRRAGFNRVSLGVQSADDRQLRALGRPHTFAQAARAVSLLRQGGFQNLSLDLIYGLAGQSLADWQETVERTAALEPEHLSCYGLKLEEGTPLWRRRSRLSFPDGDLQADMYLWTVERLGQLGYGQYEISNFARPGYPSRHNLKYWTLEEYAGFGPGAHSDVGGARWALPRDLEAFCRGALLPEREAIGPLERLREYLLLGLRTAEGISREEFSRRGGPSFAPVEAVLERCRQAGYARRTEAGWHLTPEGFLVSNRIIGLALEALEVAPTPPEAENT